MELEQIIIRMDELKEELEGLRPLREDHLNRLNQKLKLDWNYHSNSIEGNTLSKSETKSFILWGVTAKGKPFRDYVEMKGHNEALNKLYSIINKELKITESLIKEFHKLILVEPYADSQAEINPGEWKQKPNYLCSPTGERIDFVPPEEVPARMSKLINWLNNHIDPPKRKKKKYDLHPLLIAAGLHVEFLDIHPFGDGNGRMARILTNLILMLCGYVPAIIKLDNRNDYYTSINISSLDEPKNLAIFLGKEVISSLEIAIKAAKGENIEEEEDFDKELKLLEQQLLARKITLPLKSDEVIEDILEKGGFSFFESLKVALQKFNSLFTSYNSRFYVNHKSNAIVFEWFKNNIQSAIKNRNIKDANLVYSLTGLKNTPTQIDISITLKFEFNKSNYLISDNITNRKIEFRYDEYLSPEDRKAWVKDVKKSVLEKIQQVVEEG